MKLSISQNELAASLSVVVKGSASSATLPILSGILLKAENSTLILESTNLDLSIRCESPALVEEEGQTVVPAALFNNIVKKLSDAAVHISSDDVSATIVCDSTSVSLKTLDAQDFPGFPQIQPDNSVQLPFDTFTKMVKKVIKAVANDDRHTVLTGVLMEIKEGTFKLVATDSFRLAYTETPFETQAEEFKTVISGSFMRDLAGLAVSGEKIELGFNQNQVIAKYGPYTFINRRIEGSFPDYSRLFSDSYTTVAQINTKQLIGAIDRTALLSNKTSPVKFDLNLASQSIQLSTSSTDIGAAHETLGATIEGADMEISFNASNVIDGLRAVESETITLKLESNIRPGLFSVEGEENYLYIVMPMRDVM